MRGYSRHRHSADNKMAEQTVYEGNGVGGQGRERARNDEDDATQVPRHNILKRSNSPPKRAIEFGASQGSPITPKRHNQADRLSLLIFFTRHGERVDQSRDFSVFNNEDNIDPELTVEGKLQSIEAGRNIFFHIKQNEQLKEKYMHLINRQMYDLYLNKAEMAKIKKDQFNEPLNFIRRLSTSQVRHKGQGDMESDQLSI